MSSHVESGEMMQDRMQKRGIGGRKDWLVTEKTDRPDYIVRESTCVANKLFESKAKLADLITSVGQWNSLADDFVLIGNMSHQIFAIDQSEG